MSKTPYEFKLKSIDGQEVDLSQYKGKALLIVNTASQCGFTPQYKGLQKLYETYSPRGLVVLGFPSNDFGGQEPEANEKIKSFCELNYGVKFPLFQKGSVSGKDKQPFFKYLTEEANKELKNEIKWNFEKFLISKQGELLFRFSSSVNPDSAELQNAIEKALR